MQDLLLWRLLRQRSWRPDQVVPLLRQLAARPSAERLPFLGLLTPALSHPEPEVRAAAIAVLGGARGISALRRLIATLHDPDPDVRLAAVEALRASLLGHDWIRWAHVLFHPDPAVRQRGIAADRPFPPPVWYKLFLLADPTCRPEVERQLADATVSRDDLPPLFADVRRGILPGFLARRWVLALSWDDWLYYLRSQLPRERDMSDAVSSALHPDWPEDVSSNYRPDLLDDLFLLFWETEPGEGTAPSDAFFGRFLEGTLAESAYFQQWIVFTLLGIGAGRPAWPLAAARMCAVLEPGFLRCSWVPKEIRHAALAGLYELGPRCLHQTTDQVQSLLGEDVCRDEAGDLDVWAVGAVLRLLDDEPFDHALEWLDVDTLVGGLVCNVELAVLFLSLNDGPAGGRKRLIRELWRIAAPDVRWHALLAWALPGDQLDFLGHLHDSEVVEVLCRLLVLTEHPAWPVNEARAGHLADAFVPRVAAGHIGAFLRCWLERPTPETSTLGLAVLARLARQFDSALLSEVLALEAPLLGRCLTAITACPGFPHEQDLRLAQTLAARDPLPHSEAKEDPTQPDVPDQAAPSESDLETRIRTADDLDFLADCARRLVPELAFRAAERLLALGPAGVQRLVDLLGQQPPPREPGALVAAILSTPRWPELEPVQDLVRRPEVMPEARFRIGRALPRRNQKVLLSDLLDAASRPSPPGWFQEADWEHLVQLQPGGPRALALRLAASPHPEAYRPAVTLLLGLESKSAEVRQALRDFLEAGSDRDPDLRRQVAEWLYHNGGREEALPLLLQGDLPAEPPYPELLCHVPPDRVAAASDAILAAGQGEDAEKMLLALLAAGEVDPLGRQDGYARLLADASSQEVRKEARQRLGFSLGRARKLAWVGQTFAWGVRLGQVLMGRTFKIVMIAGEELGYTRLREDKLHITPLPLLRGEPYGREIVRALILHEYGHHLYHRGDEAEDVWAEGDRTGLGRLLNLVADEHLERNLRARSRKFGNYLKLLAAYAFQHKKREVPVRDLLSVLQDRSFAVLSATPLAPARREGCVRVSNGRILMEMERAGLSFARFVRALRMGLGNRHQDPKVDEALALFRKGFRRSTMPRLLEIARRLREIFGRESDLLNTFNQDSSLADDESELLDRAEGINNDDLETVVQEELESDGGRPTRQRGVRPGRGLNLSPNEEFPPLKKVEKVPHDPAEHARYAEKVARPVRQLRQYLQRLGLGLETERFRLRGKSFDQTRARAVVLRGDPRMLRARQLRFVNDLFLGVLIDCSGSMSGDNLEKAKLFGTLVAEAARGNRGIDLRLFGFTDEVIYDAGTAARCAVHGLHASAGNNDAAALWHAAEAARASRRKAKLLVMISDGSPTGCSVAALTALVQRLTRRKMCCAQVAVCKLDHVCFPNYILLEEDKLDESVRRFGQVIVRLVRQALGGG